MTQHYRDYLQSPGWKQLRAAVMARDHRKCRLCGQAAHHVHHKSYERIYRERLSDLIAVCDACHKELHGMGTSQSRTSALQAMYAGRGPSVDD